jgi:hypothetical protein
MLGGVAMDPEALRDLVDLHRTARSGDEEIDLTPAFVGQDLGVCGTREGDRGVHQIVDDLRLWNVWCVRAGHLARV